MRDIKEKNKWSSLSKQWKQLRSIEEKSRVHWQTWREAYDEILPAEFQEQMTLDKCRFYSQKYPENTLIALDDAKVVGFVSYGDFRDPATIAGEIIALYVLKDYYGKGVGQQLMQAAFAALNGYQEIILWVLEDNKRAVAFYEKMGFVFDGEEKVIDLGKAVKEERMIYKRNSNS